METENPNGAFLRNPLGGPPLDFEPVEAPSRAVGALDTEKSKPPREPKGEPGESRALKRTRKLKRKLRRSRVGEEPGRLGSSRDRLSSERGSLDRERDERRSFDVSDAIDLGIEQWLDRRSKGNDGEVPAEAAIEDDAPGVIGPLPRRKQIHQGDPDSAGMPPMAKAIQFRASGRRAFGRLGVWLWVALRFFAGNLLDRVRQLDSDQRRAVRFRMLLEGMGPAFVKIGQQLSIRADVLPYAYCEELSKLLEVGVQPFPAEQAMAAIERVTGRPVVETFAVFDPTPIGSASVSCVYQAVLPTGERVAVKVRRPGIGEAFAADLKALDWLLRLAELVGLIHPGMTTNLRTDLKNMLFEELNYWLEARYTELFARRAKTQNQWHLQAPKVYFELSGEDVLVTEYVAGVFLGEVLGAIDRGDEVALREIKAKGIDPIILAQRMTRAFSWQALEGLLFHADPHPGNVVVQSNNNLVFIDFGSCGRFPSKMKRLWMQLQEAAEREDVGAMVENAVGFLEPLPPMDVDAFRKQLEALFWDWLCAKKSKHSEWWERCTGHLWLKTIDIVQHYNVPMTIDTLRLFRAAFLYDSIAMRLWNGLDISKEYVAYSKEHGMRTRRDVRRRMKRFLKDGPTDTQYLGVEAMTDLGRQLVNRVQRYLDNPEHRFTDMLGKAAFGISMTLKAVTAGAALHVGAVLSIALGRWALGYPRLSLTDTFALMVSGTAYRIVVTFLVLILIRKSLMRFQDIDVEDTRK